jgi:hypothetical protein
MDLKLGIVKANVNAAKRQSLAVFIFLTLLQVNYKQYF